MLDATRLGLGQPIAISAETGEHTGPAGPYNIAVLAHDSNCIGTTLLRKGVAGEGLADLYLGLQPLVDEVTQQRKELFGESSDDDEDQVVDDADAAPLKLAIVGLPNAV